MNTFLFGFIHNLSGHNFFLDSIGIIAAQYLPYFLFLGFVFMAATEHGWRKKLFFFVEGLIAVILSRGLVTEIVRYFYYSPRPFETLRFQSLIPENGSSMPSGHMAFFFALSMIIYFYDKRWGIYYFVLSLAVGLARIFVGVHWPLDIVAGAIIGVLSGIFIHFILSDYLKKLAMPDVSSSEPDEAT